MTQGDSGPAVKRPRSGVLVIGIAHGPVACLGQSQSDRVDKGLVVGGTRGLACHGRQVVTPLTAHDALVVAPVPAGQVVLGEAHHLCGDPTPQDLCCVDVVGEPICDHIGGVRGDIHLQAVDVAHDSEQADQVPVGVPAGFADLDGAVDGTSRRAAPERCMRALASEIECAVASVCAFSK